MFSLCRLGREGWLTTLPLQKQELVVVYMYWLYVGNGYMHILSLCRFGREDFGDHAPASEARTTCGLYILDIRR